VNEIPMKSITDTIGTLNPDLNPLKKEAERMERKRKSKKMLLLLLDSPKNITYQPTSIQFIIITDRMGL
jgi:hypothetical protein